MKKNKVTLLNNRPIVTVTGIDEYLGSHIGLQLLNEGEFRVRGTVMNLNNLSMSKELELLQEAYGEKFKEVELV